MVEFFIAYTAEIQGVMLLKYLFYDTRSAPPAVVNYNTRWRDRRGIRLNGTPQEIAFVSVEK